MKPRLTERSERKSVAEFDPALIFVISAEFIKLGLITK